MHPICRFENEWAAKKVLELASRMVPVKLLVERSHPGDRDAARGVGEWGIFSESDCPFFRDTIFDCIREAEAMAIANELRRHDPRNLLLRSWWRKSENQDSVISNRMASNKSRTFGG